MAGADISIEIDDREVRLAFDRLISAGGNLEPAFRDIGEYLLVSHRRRFENQVDPDGQPWAPLSEDYQARKRKNRDKVLVFEGELFGQLSYDARGDRLEFGSNRIYAATHQFGAPDRGIPARPFLGLSDDDQREILAIIEDHIDRATRG